MTSSFTDGNSLTFFRFRHRVLCGWSWQTGMSTGVGSLSIVSESSVSTCTIKNDCIELCIIFSFVFFAGEIVLDVFVLVDFFLSILFWVSFSFSFTGYSEVSRDGVLVLWNGDGAWILLIDACFDMISPMNTSSNGDLVKKFLPQST